MPKRWQGRIRFCQSAAGFGSTERPTVQHLGLPSEGVSVEACLLS